MRRRLWLPGAGLALLCAAACSLVVGSGNHDFPCTLEGQVGPPVCGDDEMCVNSRCVACRDVAGGCQADGGVGGTGGEVGEDVVEDKSSTGGAGGIDAGEERRDVGNGGTGGADVSEEEGSAGGPTDTGVEEAPLDAADVAEEPPPKDLGVGETCTDSSQCLSKLCSPGITGADKACTKTCCSSTECPDKFACSPYEGATYCFLRAKLLGFEPSDSKGFGAPCGENKECLSLRCLGGFCSDVCCRNNDCNGGSKACSYSSQQNAWLCSSSPPAHGDNETCTTASFCDSTFCEWVLYDNRCAGSCCTKSDCDGVRGCTWNYDGPNRVVRRCVTAMPSDTCCKDSDCSPGQHCLPSSEDLLDIGDYKWVLRCK